MKLFFGPGTGLTQSRTDVEYSGMRRLMLGAVIATSLVVTTVMGVGLPARSNAFERIAPPPQAVAMTEAVGAQPVALTRSQTARAVSLETARTRALTAEPGTRLYVRAGTYVGPIEIKASGTSSKPIIIDGGGRVRVLGSITLSGRRIVLRGFVVDGDRGAQGRYTAGHGVTVRGNGITLAHLTVRNFKGWAINFPNRGSGHFASRFHSGRVLNCTMQNVSGGVNAVGRSRISRNVIQRLTTFGDPSMPADVFRIFGSDTVFSHNYSFGTVERDVEPSHADILQSWDDVAEPTRNIRVESNVFTGYYRQGIMLENDFHVRRGIFHISDWEVRNNVFDGFRSWAICAGKTEGGIPRFNVVNNLFRGHSSSGAYFGVYYVGTGGSGQFKNNIVLNVASSAYGVRDSAVMDEGNNAFYRARVDRRLARSDFYEVDPQLYLTGARKYAPKPGSVLIDAGAPTSSTRDIANSPRRVRQVDIGPYEQ